MAEARHGLRSGRPEAGSARPVARASALTLARRARPRLPLRPPPPRRQAVTHAVPFTTEAMQRYIKYARAIKPELSAQVRGPLLQGLGQADRCGQAAGWGMGGRFSRT
jgi:hypothetical protein